MWGDSRFVPSLNCVCLKRSVALSQDVSGQNIQTWKPYGNHIETIWKPWNETHFLWNNSLRQRAELQDHWLGIKFLPAKFVLRSPWSQVLCVCLKACGYCPLCMVSIASQIDLTSEDLQQHVLKSKLPLSLSLFQARQNNHTSPCTSSDFDTSTSLNALWINCKRGKFRPSEVPNRHSKYSGWNPQWIAEHCFARPQGRTNARISAEVLRWSCDCLSKKGLCSRQHCTHITCNMSICVDEHRWT